MIIRGEVYYSEDQVEDILSDNDRFKEENEMMRIALRDITEIPPEFDETSTLEWVVFYITAMVAVADEALAKL